MEAQQQPTAAYQPPLADRLRHSKSLVAIIAVLGVTVLALGAALVVNRSEAQPGGPQAQALNAPAEPATPRAGVPLAAPAAPKSTVNNLASTSAKPAPAVVARANVCRSCGTVESVVAVKKPGKVNGVNVGNATIGLGTVAGGVLGGLLGNQVGGGNGKTAMTVIGAAGGAYAGNQIEQNMNSVTVYNVRVRMDDGSYRTVEVGSPVAVGAQVTVEGRNLRLANSAG